MAPDQERRAMGGVVLPRHNPAGSPRPVVPNLFLSETLVFPRKYFRVPLTFNDFIALVSMQQG